MKNWHRANRDRHLAEMKEWHVRNRAAHLAYYRSYRENKRIERLQRMEKNPYNSKTNPREYSAWYHRHHPGYFASKTKEWFERQSSARKAAFFAKRNKKSRDYINAYKKLQRRLDQIAEGPPSFNVKETRAINESPTLARMLRQLKIKFC
jgi:hypothetical protein